ncbi:hypothetical protein GCM10009119_43270 [Algoriphagus jejuensis]|uniref:Capsule assembly protein Wzi n=1 Tax=Algoriphagus jejuensis TaxID=419934 RepID=A0ABN1N5U5_9BACT
MRKIGLLTFFTSFFFAQFAASQSLPSNFPVLEENLRRNQLLDTLPSNVSFLLKPILADSSTYPLSDNLIDSELSIRLTPIINTTRVSTKRPYAWGDYGMIPNPGFQTYFSGGVEMKYKFINLTFRPELVIAQNKGFFTGLDEMSNSEIRDRFFFWNNGDFPERFGKTWIANPWWGQSKLTVQYGAFEIGGSTQNIWWGPGQFNALTYSNNAQGFPHLSLNTIKPARTLIGNFEGQIIMGRLENSGLAPSQEQALDDLYFRPFTGDWRYTNAITISWNPKWVKGFFLGFSRTFQQYDANRGNEFLDWFPIFEGLQKKNFFEDGNTVDFDANGRDQTITFFGRVAIPKSKSELYFELGRRDHAYNWRDYILNPDHARAYILGFVQLFDLPQSGRMIQVRGEMTQQQESVNRYIRYLGVKGGLTWHTHTRARGFVNYGQPLGVGIGVGSNVQTMEFALVDGLDKIGVSFERLANNQDFYYKAQLQETERKPWIDLSLGFLYDKKFENLLVSSKLQVIHAKNYQWQLDPASTAEFPKGENLTSMLAQVSLIYFWKQNEN